MSRTRSAIPFGALFGLCFDATTLAERGIDISHETVRF